MVYCCVKFVGGSWLMNTVLQLWFENDCWCQETNEPPNCEIQARTLFPADKRSLTIPNMVLFLNVQSEAV